jgi:hypothetical protein
MDIEKLKRDGVNSLEETITLCYMVCSRAHQSTWRHISEDCIVLCGV